MKNAPTLAVQTLSWLVYALFAETERRARTGCETQDDGLLGCAKFKKSKTVNPESVVCEPVSQSVMALYQVLGGNFQIPVTRVIRINNKTPWLRWALQHAQSLRRTLLNTDVGPKAYFLTNTACETQKFLNCAGCATFMKAPDQNEVCCRNPTIHRKIWHVINAEGGHF